jgi:hypothetical protein
MAMEMEAEAEAEAEVVMMGMMEIAETVIDWDVE